MGITEQCGKYSGFARPGPSFLCYPFETIAGKLSTRVQQLNVRTDTKTRDNVTLAVMVAVQFRVIDRPLEAAVINGDAGAPQSQAILRGNQPEDHGLWRAYYRLTNPAVQIQSYVEDTVRSELPKKTLDEAYEAKDDVALAVKQALQHEMKQYGFEVVQALVTDLQPDSKVMNASNEINAQRRMRFAAQEKAEAEKVIIVKRAEADADAMYLGGVGVARQRKAIIDGLKDSVAGFTAGVEGTTPEDVMELMVVTQYLDMMKDVGSKAGAKTLFVPHGEGGMATAVRQGTLESGLVSGGGRR
jgi:regulator of protease activity HflC (stomatin/prohibitin superfamily)